MKRRNFLEVVIGFKPTTERIYYIKVHGKFYNSSLPSIHSFTEEKDNITKDIFCAQIKRVYATQQDMKIRLGDFNKHFEQCRIYNGQSSRTD